MVTRVPAVGGVLEWARDNAGLTVAEAALKLNLKAETLGKIENGDLHPSVSVFRNMAQLYALSEATLLAEAPLPLPPLPTDHRTFDGFPARLTNKTVAAIRRVWDRQTILEELAEDDPEIIPPTLPRMSMRTNPEELGSDERSRLGFTVARQLKTTPERALIDWRLILENQGISTYIEDFPLEEARGVSLYEGSFPAIILNRREKQPGARLFTLMHEYAHLLTRTAGISDLNPRNNVEAYCNTFAAAFLMPDVAVRAVFNVAQIKRAEPSIDALARAAKSLCVTISALALRLEELNFVRTGYYASIRGALSAPTPVAPEKPKGDGGPAQKYLVLSHVGHFYADTILGTLERGNLSRLEASRLLDTAPTHFAGISEVIQTRRSELADAG